jgi:glucan phosphoethanolaminetransferase (alkaline phosphatase superfamily)
MLKLGKVVLFLATCWVPLYFIFIFINFISSWISTTSSDNNNIVSMFGPSFLLYMITLGIWIVLIFVYILHIVNNRELESSSKTLWVVLVLFTSFIGMIIYFIKSIWADQKKNGKANISGNHTPSNNV